jgi:hypothetical protein
MSSLGFTANRPRVIKPGWEYINLIPRATMTENVVARNGNVRDTVHVMAQVVHKYKHQLEKIAPLLKGVTLEDTCRKVFNFFHDHYQYINDEKGLEQLKSPARFFADRFTGGDCDDFSISVSSALCLLNIPHYIRVTAYDHDWQHVYIIVPEPSGGYYTIDCVLDQFDAEKPFSKKFDYKMNPNSNALSGIPIVVLSGVEAIGAYNPELDAILNGADFNEVNTLLGLGSVPNQKQMDDSLYKHLVRTRDYILKNPNDLLFQGGAKANLRMFNYAIDNWNTPNRQRALDILAKEENKWQNVKLPSELKGLEDILFGDDDDLILDHEYSLLGKISLKKFWNNVKKTATNIAKETVKVGKKVLTAIIRYNPITLGMRAGYLLAMGVNLGGLASRISPGLLTKNEAKAKKMSDGDHRHGINAYAASKKQFVTILKGRETALKKAVRKGQGSTALAGELDGLGVVATATIAAAAVPLIATAKDMDSAGVPNPEKKKWHTVVFDSIKKYGKKLFGKRDTADIDASAEPGHEQTAPPQGYANNTDAFLPIPLDAEPQNQKSNTGLYIALGAAGLLTAAVIFSRLQAPRASRPQLSGISTQSYAPSSPYPQRKKKKAKKVRTILLR